MKKFNSLPPDSIEILNFLNRDWIKNINIIGFAQKNEVVSIEKTGNAVLMRGRSDRLWTFISCYTTDELIQVINLLNDSDRNYAVLEDWMIPFIIKGKKCLWDFETIRLYLPKEVKLELSTYYKIASLENSDAEYIYNHSHFKEYTSISYIKDCISCGITGGIYIDGKLACWAMTHDDKAIGFLHVLEEYRNRGLATGIMKYMAQKTREQGMIPFVHVEETNVKSMNLMLKSGFKKDKKIHWCEVV